MALEQVYIALTKKGYNPCKSDRWLYVSHRDPTYITSHKGKKPYYEGEEMRSWKG